MRFKGGRDLFNQLSIMIFPIFMPDQGVEIKCDRKSSICAETRRIQALLKRGGEVFFVVDDLLRIERPTEDHISSVREVQEMVDIIGFRFEFQIPLWVIKKELHESCVVKRDGIKCETVHSFSSPYTKLTQRVFIEHGMKFVDRRINIGIECCGRSVVIALKITVGAIHGALEPQVQDIVVAAGKSLLKTRASFKEVSWKREDAECAFALGVLIRRKLSELSRGFQLRKLPRNDLFGKEPFHSLAQWCALKFWGDHHLFETGDQLDHGEFFLKVSETF